MSAYFFTALESDSFAENSRCERLFASEKYRRIKNMEKNGKRDKSFIAIQYGMKLFLNAMAVKVIIFLNTHTFYIYHKLIKNE